MKITTTITQSHAFSPQDIGDLITTALEGGINYWCKKVIIVENPDGTYKGVSMEDEENVKHTSDAVGYGGELKFYDAESEDVWFLDAEKMGKGIQMYCEEYSIPLKDLIDEHDADSADAIIQYAIFGELVFG